jgi:GT2 family glycosyltransferase
MTLSVILLNYKKPELTITCLESLFRMYGNEFTENLFEVIVVDNASGDRSLEKIEAAVKKHAFSNIQIHVNKTNEGFSRGCNAGAEKAKGELLLFLNNDTIVEDRGIATMVKYMHGHDDAAVLGGKLMNMDGTSQHSTGKFYTLLRALFFLLGSQRLATMSNNPNTVTKVDWVKGGCMMVRKSVFTKLSGFDEKIFMYIEDMEFCYRAKKAGYNTYFFPDVSIRHADQGSSSRSFAVVQIYKGILYFYKKHRSYGEYALIKTVLYTKAVVAIGIGTLTGNKYLKSTFTKAIQF